MGEFVRLPWSLSVQMSAGTMSMSDRILDWGRFWLNICSCIFSSRMVIKSHALSTSDRFVVNLERRCMLFVAAQVQIPPRMPASNSWREQLAPECWDFVTPQTQPHAGMWC